jgi:hypothetical protein
MFVHEHEQALAEVLAAITELEVHGRQPIGT